MRLFSKYFKQKTNTFHNLFEQTMATGVNENKIYIEEEEAELEGNEQKYSFLETIAVEEFASRYVMELTILIEQVRPTYIEQITIGYKKKENKCSIQVEMICEQGKINLSSEFKNPYAIKLLEREAMFNESEIVKAVLGIRRCMEQIKWEQYYKIRKDAIVIESGVALL